MPEKAWKATERKVAARFGGKRVPVTGRQRGDAPDVEHPSLCFEVKAWKTLPAWFTDAMDQAVKSSRGKKLPVVVLHEKGRRMDNAYAIVRMKDLPVLLGLFEAATG